jgi:hypothetical protein
MVIFGRCLEELSVLKSCQERRLCQFEDVMRFSGMALRIESIKFGESADFWR